MEETVPLSNKHVFAEFPNEDWKLYVITKNPNYTYLKLIPDFILSLISALVFGFFLNHLLRTPYELNKKVKKQAHELLKSELLFKTIFDRAAIGIAIADGETSTFLKVNSYLCHLLGFKEKELVSKDLNQLIHPEDLEDNLTNKIDESNFYTIEKRIYTKKKQLLWVNIIISTLEKIENQPTQNIIILEDITTKKLETERIEKSNKRFKSLFEDSPIPMWEEDFSELKIFLNNLNIKDLSESDIMELLDNNPDLLGRAYSTIKTINVNKKAIDLHEAKSKSEIIERIPDIITRETLDALKKQLVAIIKGKKEFQIDTRIRTLKNTKKDINFRWNSLEGYEETLERIIITTEDISEKKIAQQKIIDSEKQINELINTIDGIVWEAVFPSFQFRFISNKVESILGYEKQEILNDTTFWISSIHPEEKDSVINKYKTLIEKGGKNELEYRIIAKDGNIVWIRNIFNILPGNNKTPEIILRGILLDITQSKQSEIDLIQSFDLVSRQNQKLLDFSYIVSHNLRSHTSNVLSIINLLEMTDDETEKKELIMMIHKVASELDESITHLNKLTAIQNTINTEKEKLLLKPIIEKIVTDRNKQIQEKNAIIYNMVPDSAYIRFNKLYLENILNTFIENSLHFKNDHTNPVITLRFFDEKNQKVLQITDNGVGIDLSKYKDKVFGLYKTFHKDLSKKGVSLFIAKSQIESMGGKINVESTPHVGTIIKVYFYE